MKSFIPALEKEKTKKGKTPVKKSNKKSSPMLKAMGACALLLCLFTGSAKAQQSTTRFYFAYDHEELTIAGTAIGFTTSKLNSSSGQAALVTFTIDCNGGGTTCPIRFLVDGNTPTASVGQGMDYLYSGASYNYDNNRRFKAIRTGATSAIMHVIYYR